MRETTGVQNQTIYIILYIYMASYHIYTIYIYIPYIHTYISYSIYMTIYDISGSMREYTGYIIILIYLEVEIIIIDMCLLL